MLTERYQAIMPRSTGDHPYGPFGGGTTFAGFSTREGLVRRSSAAVVAEVVSISPPHFNSDDGGFFLPGPGQSRGVVQDVRLRVSERWGDLIGLPDEFDLLVPGGQVAVELNDEQAKAEELPAGGRFIFGSEPSVELVVGERALLFLNEEQVPWQGESVSKVLVVGGFQGKFGLAGEGQVTEATNDRRPEWTTRANTLRAEVARELGADRGPS
ncbi:MAG TPA: hypothetical protein VK988_00050 [Acidimicrobiales bacterium]|nr:hypothetical protein [Acidimicrobiales bacterium]